MVILIKSTLTNWVIYFSFVNVFFPSKFPHKTTSVEICAVWVSQRHAITFLESVKKNSNFSKTSEWQETLRRKANKSYYKTAVRNDPVPRKLYKKNCKLDSGKCHAIIEVIEAIIEVYFELLVTIFHAQISCSCHSKFVKIISILMLRVAITVFVYISFPASTKTFWLVTCPTNSGQK